MILSGSCLGFCNPIFQAVDGMKKGPFYAIKYFLNNSMMLMGHVMDHEHHEFENKAKKNSIFISLDQEYHEANCKMHFQMKINYIFFIRKNKLKIFIGPLVSLVICKCFCKWIFKLKLNLHSCFHFDFFFFTMIFLGHHTQPTAFFVTTLVSFRFDSAIPLAARGLSRRKQSKQSVYESPTKRALTAQSSWWSGFTLSGFITFYLHFLLQIQ